MPQKNRTHPKTTEADASRDRLGINKHLKVKFHDVLAERGSARSFDLLWEFTTLGYEVCRDCWYGLLTCLCGCYIAMFWGCQFAVLGFQHVWFLTPFAKSFKLCCTGVFQKCFKLLLDCCITPWTTACGGFFRVFHTDKPTVYIQNERKAKVASRNKPEENPPQDAVVLLPVPVLSSEKTYIGSNPTNAQKSIQRQMGLFI